MQIVASFGLFHRQRFRLDQDDLPTTTYHDGVRKLWRTVTYQIGAPAVQKLFRLYREPLPHAHLAQKFNDMLKPLLIEGIVEDARDHLRKRISSSGWPHGPQLPFVEWMSTANKTAVGSVLRFSALRWALIEDSDGWLAKRGKHSRVSPCCQCQAIARKYLLGPQWGALCDTLCSVACYHALRT